ncbi:MAG: hypothetical protein JWR21_4350 [Herminiimonas sp.]|nr:hypothetical protein [Herminiimonas sp.]
MTPFKPFQDEKTSLAVDDLTIENRLDRISIYGSIQITKDKAGLQQARKLKELIDATVMALDKASLPDHVAITPSEKVKNPFD